ncbi:hypothetical protein Cni_G17442 [Canna indica]|uniref:Reverse transcriptase domain-containing protein n=1 Tax=Canna indica TaxID=4628 RepID=A0AAQ3KHQ8_9LILI|nr:hypothetical protein Cni_G17442 [Canna indica]
MLVDESQCAFLKGRSTLDSYMAVSELVHFCKKIDYDALLIKLDMEKSFDSISWDFLLRLLEACGFSSIWIDWISQLLFSSESAVLVNDNPGPWFKHKKGLRQGDPLSPYLFILVADVFAKFINLARSQDTIRGIKINDHLEVANLEFADDFLVFTRGSKDDILNLKIMLLGFELMTGLRDILAAKIPFCMSVQSSLGNGASTKFWLDNWTDCRSLASSFLDLFSASNQRNANVAYLLNTENNIWRFSWHHHVDETRVDDLVFVIRNMHDLDSISWKWEANGGFSTASLYMLMKNVASFNRIWPRPGRGSSL